MDKAIEIATTKAQIDTYTLVNYPAKAGFWESLISTTPDNYIKARLGRSKVKDLYEQFNILEKMQEKGWRIGAENSGHVILLDKTTTGDGIVAGLQVLAAMARNHMSLHDLCSGMKMFPQILVNVRYTAGSGDPLEHESVKAVTAEVEAALGNRGRVLLRKSGTEPLIRVMVEGEDEAQVTEFAHRIADAVKAV